MFKHANKTFTRRAAVTAALAGAAIAVPVAMASSASADSVNWGAVAQCESGGNWSIDTGNGFYGGLQFTESTWQAYGGTQYAQYPNQASESDQIAVAEQVLAGQGIGAWPVCGANAGSGGSYSGTNTSGSGSSSSSSSADQSGSDASSQSSSSSDQGSSSSDQSAQTQTQSAPVQSAPAQAPVTTSAPAASSASGSYTVQSGDTLSGIAAKEGVNWHTLYAHNASIVGSNPNLILPGQVLNLG